MPEEEGSPSWSEIDALGGDEADGWEDLKGPAAAMTLEEQGSSAWEDDELPVILSVVPWRGQAHLPGHGLTLPYRCCLSQTVSTLRLNAPCEGLPDSGEVVVVVAGLSLLVELETVCVDKAQELVLGRVALSGQVLVDPGEPPEDA
jgi:hypothetical protein